MTEEHGTRQTIQIQPAIPSALGRLEELAVNLRYSWDSATRAMFSRLHPQLWDAIGHSPKTILKCVDEQRLAAAAADPAFMHGYARALASYDAYLADRAPRDGVARMQGGDLVAYFCAEFGFHESLPIYSGGLGILAGDHCKTASDLRLPFVGVGLLYRQGYFAQRVDEAGHQHAAYHDSDFDCLPIAPARGPDGRDVRVEVSLPGRQVHARVWCARVGHVPLYLLDTDVPENAEHDRAITYRLYGGGSNTRMEQEIVLGMGGVRALRALGVAPTVWHINEGHAAFLVLERVREVVLAGAGFDAALEAVAASTVFTTHTAVAAGHDRFSVTSVSEHFDGYCRELDVSHEQLLALGRVHGNPDFNMTSLAVRGSRQQNGVSRIHQGVSAELLRELWPQIPLAESPVSHVTNAIHVPTFLAPEWHETFDRLLGGGWDKEIERHDWAARIDSIPDEAFWKVRLHLKSQLMHLVRYRMREQHARNRVSEAHLDRVLRQFDPAHPDVLVIGFGRRFATYKRAALLFSQLELLSEIISGTGRPVVFVFAGKAHPADGPGQDIIRRISEISHTRKFEGKVLLVEGYDLRLSRRMVSGVDVWLNNPIYPLEASGTSGMKAAINGVVNLSVLDGWWEEGYDGANGWAVKPVALHYDAERSDLEEARALYEILQDQVVPLYYGGDNRARLGYSPGWIRLAKRSMASILPRFNTQRMLREYIDGYYARAAEQGRRYAAAEHALAREVAAWKTRVRAAWAGITARRVDSPQHSARYGESVPIEVALRLNGLAPDDVVVELVLARDYGANLPVEHRRYRFDAAETDDGGETRYRLKLAPDLCGPLEYRIRLYPHHAGLTHAFELGLMRWI